MSNVWRVWGDDEPANMPPLVDGPPTFQPPPASIPPPPGATHITMPSAPAPPTAPVGAGQYPPWGTPFPNPSHALPSPHDRVAAWSWYYNNAGYPQPSGPSPYIPREPLYPEMPSHDPFVQVRRTQSLSNPSPGSRKRSNSLHKHSPWPSHGDLSPLDIPTRMPDVPTRMPDVHQFVPRPPDMHTPSSTLSRSFSMGPHALPELHRDRPMQWRNDFKFKSGFASMLRSWSNPTRGSDPDYVDSAKLVLHPFLRYNKTRPSTVYDLRQEPLTLVFRELDHRPLAGDMDHSVTHPPTQYMRVYHSRLPWYIDIRANGAPYISLADFFQQLFAALRKQISKYDFYNNELDDSDRDILTRTYYDRCHDEAEKMQGVKRVDFLRGKYQWMGLAPGRNGMWRLRTN